MQRTRVLLFLLVPLLLLTAPLEARRRSVRSPAPPEDATLTTNEWLNKHAIAFATDHPESGFEDLNGLSAIVGDSRIVSLGEATHGTHEFFTMKHRVLEYLVEKMGFTVFAIEAALPECDVINDYVVNGNGDPAAALAGQHFWTWNTDEVLQMILWMRNHNLLRGEKPPIYFRGYDVQFSAMAIHRATAYVQRIDPSGTSAIRSKWNCFVPYSGNLQSYGAQPASFREKCHADVAAAHAAFEAKRDDYTSRSSASEYEQMLRYARVVVQHEAFSGAIGEARSSLRDSLMAENAVWLANVAHPREKFVLWAHNYHVSSATGTMGSHLREIFPGREMVIFGFAFDHGSFNAVTTSAGGRLQPSTVSAFDGGFDSLFRETGHARWIADFRDIGSIEARDYFAEPRTMWSVGAVFDSNAPISFYRANSRVPGAYDAIIWFAETTASKLRGF